MKHSAIAGVLFLLTVIGVATQSKPTPAAIDSLMAPVALYPDQLLAQMLESSKTPEHVLEFRGWLKTNAKLTGTALQDAAKEAGFDPSLVLLALFPKVVTFMADNVVWTTQVGQAFTGDRAAVFDSVQRLRANALKAGTLKNTDQQKIVLKTANDGSQVIVIEPANPQVVYVPQYNTQTVYTNAPTTTVVVHEEDNDAGAAVAGAMIGFGVGIAIGATMDNHYYYGPYGWHGGPMMYNDAWDDWYDDREDAREDFYDNREDARDDYRENREDLAEERTDRRENTQEQRTERAENRQDSGRTAPAQRSTSSGASSASTARSGTKSDAFSGYSNGRSEKAASDRGKSSRSRSSSSGSRSKRK